jgi:hypothetical protein
MPRYAITEKAGRFVAGQNNTGVGTVLTLTAKQAAHELRLGTLQSLDKPSEKKAGGGKARKADPKPDEAGGEGGGDEKEPAE